MPRFADLGLLLLAAPFVLPLMLLLALLVRIFLGGPMLFTQPRGGKDGRIFRVYKFRTMTQQVDAEGQFLPDADRLTSFGKFMRAASLDELPSLLNVARGEMRIVGPRPFIADYLPLYSPAQRRRHEVVPGITGWAQVKGRNSLSWEEKFALDIWYVDNRSLWLDLRILALTVLKVFRRDGIAAEGEVTMPRFTGTKG
jgi:sugar transferase EpsL